MLLLCQFLALMNQFNAFPHLCNPLIHESLQHLLSNTFLVCPSSFTSQGYLAVLLVLYK